MVKKQHPLPDAKRDGKLMSDERRSVNRITVVLIILAVCLVLSLLGNVLLMVSNRREANVQLVDAPEVDEEDDFWARIVEEYVRLEQMEDSEAYTLRHDILLAIFAEKAEQVTKDCTSVQEEVISVAQWIAANISNTSLENRSTYSSVDDIGGWFSTRNGLCGARSLIAVAMLEARGIVARTVGMFDFPTVGDSHVCIETYYDSSWHFVDVTYAGYFMVGDVILSLDDMMGDIPLALQNMVVLVDGIDNRSPPQNEAGPETPLYDREYVMTATYTYETLNALRSYGVNTRQNRIILYPEISADVLPLQLGDMDGDRTDVDRDGIAMGLSGYLSCSFGLPGNDINLQALWTFTGMEVGQTYILEFMFIEPPAEGTAFFALAQDAEMLPGTETYESQAEFAAQEWNIIFVPQQTECTILVGYDFTDLALGASIDSIRINVVRE